MAIKKRSRSYTPSVLGWRHRVIKMGGQYWVAEEHGEEPDLLHTEGIAPSADSLQGLQWELKQMLAAVNSAMRGEVEPFDL